MSKLPKDCTARIIGAEARKLVHFRFPSENWEYHEMTGRDNGLDCTVELVENEEWTNKKIEGQIKGTRSPRQLKNGDAFALEMEIKTIRYGLGSSCAFVVFYVDVEEETVYYLPLQDYFISKPELFDKLDNNKSQITVHVPCDNIVCENDYDLQQIAKSIYIDGPSRKLRKV